MKIALITLSNKGARIALFLAQDPALNQENADLYFHESISIFPESPKSFRFGSIIALTGEIFHKYEGLVFIAPSGVAVRAIARNIKNKLTDPAVVLVDAGTRFVISLLGGHERGANNLAIEISNVIGAEPVITTTTEAEKSFIVGIGCRLGVHSKQIIKAIEDALLLADVKISQVRLLASADIKSNEKGLRHAAKILNIPLRFINSEEIRLAYPTGNFEKSDFVEEKVKVPAVCEPAALLAGRRTQLVLPKIKFNGITIAVAKEKICENFLS